MAQLKIKGNVRIGHIYECFFGNFKHIDGDNTTSSKHEACEDDYNYRIPNEMIKKRAVVVIGKHRGQYIVVPISSTKETHKKEHKEPENTGLHTKLTNEDFPETHHYTNDRDRWAKSNLISTIDGGRLRDIYNENIGGLIVAHKVTDETLLKIRHGVFIAIGMRDSISDNS